MTKAKIFLYEHAQIYYRKYGIDPDKHFDRMCEKYGIEVAGEIIERNMIKAFECMWKERREKEKEQQCILESECPFE